LIDGMIILSKT